MCVCVLNFMPHFACIALNVCVLLLLILKSTAAQPPILRVNGSMGYAVFVALLVLLCYLLQHCFWFYLEADKAIHLVHIVLFD